MPKDIKKERMRREMDYAYEIGLLVKGMPCKDVFILSKTMGNRLSLKTLYNLKKEFIDTPYER